MSIHPTAIVHPSAELGTNVEVGPFSYVEKDVVIDNDTVIAPRVSVLRYTTIGRKCSIHSGAILGDTPQDLAFEDAVSYVMIGANCTIREGVTIHRGSKPDTYTTIGDNCYLMAFSHFAHNVTLGNGAIVANGALCAGYSTIGEQAFLSGNCGIHQFTRVGRLAMVGALSTLTKDLPPFCTSAPASFCSVLGLNVVGMRRAGMDSALRKDVKRTFDILYRSGLNTTQAIEEIRKTFDSGPALEISSFIESSERGICSLNSRPGSAPRT